MSSNREPRKCKASSRLEQSEEAFTKKMKVAQDQRRNGQGLSRASRTLSSVTEPPLSYPPSPPTADNDEEDDEIQVVQHPHPKKKATHTSPPNSSDDDDNDDNNVDEIDKDAMEQPEVDPQTALGTWPMNPICEC
jgi:hypothetical protein